MNLDQPLIGLGAAGALISAVGTAVALALRSRTRERLAAIQGASEQDRARLVADAIAMFEIPVEGMTKEQRYELVVRQLEDRNRQRQRTFILALVLMAILAGTTIVLALHDASPKTPVPSGTTTSGGPATQTSNDVRINGNNNNVQSTNTVYNLAPQ